MSLRELPPGQNDLSRWRHLRYVPLAVLMVLVVVAAVVGFIVSRANVAPAPLAPQSEASSPYMFKAAQPSVMRPPA